MDDKRHAGRIAVVTGGSQGIGQAIVLRLVQEGASVAIIDMAERPDAARGRREGHV